MLTNVLLSIMIGISVITLFFLFSQRRSPTVSKEGRQCNYMSKHSSKEIARLESLRKVSLNVPLAEKTRPKDFS